MRNILSYIFSFLTVMVLVVDASSNTRFSTYRTSATANSPASSTSSASSETFAGYTVPSYVLATKGGIELEKAELTASGAVYVPRLLRDRFTRADPGWTYFGNIEDYAICRGRAKATNATQHAVDYRYYMCPNDIHDIFNYQEKYCCGSTDQQYCCDKDAFFRQYGVLVPGTSVVVIVVTVICSIVGTCLCCCVTACCVAGMSDEDKKKLKSRASIKRTSGQGADAATTAAAAAPEDVAAAAAVAAAYPSGTGYNTAYGMVALPPIVVPPGDTGGSSIATAPLIDPPPPPYPGPV